MAPLFQALRKFGIYLCYDKDNAQAIQFKKAFFDRFEALVLS